MTMKLGFRCLFLAMASACSAGESEPPAPPPAVETTAPEVGTLDALVEIDEVQVLQGTSAVLVHDGARVDAPNAPVIAARPAMIRVHARPLEKRTKLPPLAAQLRLVRPGRPDLVLDDGPRTLAELDPADLKTSFDFDVPAEELTAETSMSVTVRDPARADAPVKLLGGAPLHLHARDKGTTLRVAFVPVRYEADGSGRLPPLGPAQVEAYKRALYKLYPVANVEVSVRADIPWGIAVGARGDGWSQLLAAIMGARRNDVVDDDVYYVGVFAPAPSIDQYCHGGCVLGIAPAGGVLDVGLRVAMVVGFEGANAADGTLAQELAHAMGRMHAPCGGPEFVDPEYPYGGAGIGVAGWDVVKKQLVDPDTRRFDFMSYCQPVWVSDYTWAGIHARMEQVEAERLEHERIGGTKPEDHRVRSYVVGQGGALSLGPEIPIHGGALADADRVVRYEDAAGRSLGAVRGAFRRLDGVAGGVLLAPEPPEAAARVRVDGLSAQPLVLRSR